MSFKGSGAVYMYKYIIGTSYINAEGKIDPLCLPEAIKPDGTLALLDFENEFKLFDTKEKATDYIKEQFPEYRLRMLTGNDHLVKYHPMEIECKHNVFSFHFVHKNYYSFLSDEQIQQQEESREVFTRYFKYDVGNILYYSEGFVLTQGKLHTAQERAKSGYYGQFYVI